MKRLIISYGLFVVDVEKKRFTSHWMQQQFGKVASKMQQSCGTPARTYNTHAEEIEIKIKKENNEKQSACVCVDDTQQPDEGGAREQTDYRNYDNYLKR